jgi:GrpB-like predicted nucleotidyltransferase (UPF0157 family)
MSSDADQLVICDYDPAWPGQFADLSAKIAAALRSVAPRIEHVGSTAVQGLAAKPIIDLDVVLASLVDLPEAIHLLAALGYVHEGDLGVKGREAFRWPSGEARHHVYVLIEGTAELRRHIAFRDALRANAGLRDEFAKLKRSLASRYSGDRDAYTEGKSAFIRATMVASNHSSQVPKSKGTIAVGPPASHFVRITRVS